MSRIGLCNTYKRCSDGTTAPDTVPLSPEDAEEADNKANEDDEDDDEFHGSDARQHVGGSFESVVNQVVPVRRVLVQLAPGSHRVEIRKSGYKPYSTTVNIRSGQTFTVNVSLSQQ